MKQVLISEELLRQALGDTVFLSRLANVDHNERPSVVALRAALEQPGVDIRDLLIQAAATAVLLERKDEYQSATRVADSILKSEECMCQAQQQEPVQEPARRCIAIEECLFVLRPSVKGKFPQEQALEELAGYTAQPRKAVKLSDEEIKEAIRHLYQDATALQIWMDISLPEFRAIEHAVWAKLGGVK